MKPQTPSSGRRICFEAALVIATLSTLLSGCQEPLEGIDPSDLKTPTIEEHGRLTVTHASIDPAAPFALVLMLTEPEGPSAPRPVRLVSTDGRRQEALAHPAPSLSPPAPAPASGLRLEVDPAFLTPGSYLIQVDTTETHPLNFRRYVLIIE